MSEPTPAIALSVDVGRAAPLTFVSRQDVEAWHAAQWNGWQWLVGDTLGGNGKAAVNQAVERVSKEFSHLRDLLARWERDDIDANAVGSHIRRMIVDLQIPLTSDPLYLLATDLGDIAGA